MLCCSDRVLSSLFTISTLLIAISPTVGAQQSSRSLVPDLHKSALKSTTPSDEILRIDIDNDGKPDIVERWWNGKRVRWLDENGDLLPTDTRGDQVNDVLQVDKNGDGLYDGPFDLNVKWADNDGDGKADLQPPVIPPPQRSPRKRNPPRAPKNFLHPQGWEGWLAPADSVTFK